MPSTVGSNNNACAGNLSGKKIILGVTGGVAAYKAAYIASSLVQRGADVHVVMTEHATKLIGPATFWSLTSNPVLTDLFEPPKEREIVHVSLPESADLLLIAPATANIIGKLAHGIADDMLSTMAMVVRCPVIIAPAMNVHMYSNPIVAANMARLRDHGCIFVDPESGRLACGDEGIGRLADPDKIVKVLEQTLIGGSCDYDGVSMLVTAGPTQEPIDPVRYITNYSSGKMGYAIAENAARRGARVTLVSGPTDLEAPPGVEVVHVRTVKQMHDAVMQRIDETRVLIAAAAPADFAPAQTKNQKIKKSGEDLTLHLAQTVDILAEAGRRKDGIVLVGFAAETQNLEDFARAKLQRKNLDLIVANDVSPESNVFGSDTNQVTLLSKSGDKISWPRMSKHEVANRILDYVRTNLL